ncbi:MAG: PAS domain-containing protein [Pseudomonadota bacterium]
MSDLDAAVAGALSNKDGLFDIVSKFHCIAHFNLTGELLEANQNFLDVLGYTLDEIIGVNHRTFLVDPKTKDPQYANMWPSFADGQAKSGEVLRRTKTGQIVWLQSVYCPMRNANGQVDTVLKLAVLKPPELTDDGVNVPLNLIREGVTSANALLAPA